MIVLVSLNPFGFPIFSGISGGYIPNFVYACEIHTFVAMFVLSTIQVVCDSDIHHTITVAKFILVGISTHTNMVFACPFAGQCEGLPKASGFDMEPGCPKVCYD